MNKADLYKAYKVLDFSHKKIEMELNDMKDEIQYAEKIADSKKSSWETNKRLLKENTQLKKENEMSGGLNKSFSIKNGNLNVENRKLKEENEKLKEKYAKFRARNCDRMEELVKALSPWKKNHEDHKRILEAIVELKEEHQKLLDDIELHPDYEETIKSTIEEQIHFREKAITDPKIAKPKQKLCEQFKNEQIENVKLNSKQSIRTWFAIKEVGEYYLGKYLWTTGK